jgi:hypothetical protein
MFSYSTGYYVSPPDDQYLKFKNRCSLLYMNTFLCSFFFLCEYVVYSACSVGYSDFHFSQLWLSHFSRICILLAGRFLLIRLNAYSACTLKNFCRVLRRIRRNLAHSLNAIKHFGVFSPKRNLLKTFGVFSDYDKTLLTYSRNALKGIVQPFELGGETRLFRSAVKY